MFKTITIIVLASLLIVSCGKPNSPEDYTGGYQIAAKFQTAGYTSDVLIDGDICYVTQGEGGLSILNISDPKNPTLIKNLSEGVRGYSTKMAKKDNILYIAASGFGVTVVDVADPTSPEVTGSNLNVKPAKNFHIMGDYLITAVSELGFKFSSIETPAYPDIRGVTHTDGYTKAITTTADESKLFAVTGEMGLSVYDIAVIDDGYGIYPLLGTIDLPGYAESVVLNEDKQVAFIACGSAGIQVIDYTEPSNLKIIGSYECPGHAKEVVYENNKLYVAASGMQVYDVSTASDPKLLGIVDTDYALSVAIDTQYIYLADKEEGVVIIPKK